MGTKVHIDELGPVAEELYNALNNARAFRGRMNDRPADHKHKAADTCAILQIEEDLVVILGRLSLAGVPIPQSPSLETADVPPLKARRKPS